MKRVTRIISIPCPDCWGTGKAVGGHCDTCRGTGNVQRQTVELVPDETDEDAHALVSNAGATQ